MTTRKPMTVKFQRLLASRVRFALDCAACSFNGSIRDHINDALDECAKAERLHRAMGRRWTSGGATYRGTLDDCAALMMGRSFFCEAPERAKGSLADVAGYRSDHLHMVLAYAAIQAYETRFAGTGKPTGKALDPTLERLEAHTDELRAALNSHGYLSVVAALADWDYSIDVAVRV